MGYEFIEHYEWIFWGGTIQSTAPLTSRPLIILFHTNLVKNLSCQV